MLLRDDGPARWSKHECCTYRNQRAWGRRLLQSNTLDLRWSEWHPRRMASLDLLCLRVAPTLPGPVRLQTLSCTKSGSQEQFERWRQHSAWRHCLARIRLAHHSGCRMVDVKN